MMAGPAANIIAAPNACSTRKPTSDQMDQDRVQAREPTVNRTKPVTYTLFSPIMSANRPKVSRSVLMINR